MIARIQILLVSLLCCILISCGGGSEGTGISVRIVGKLVDTQEAPIPDATVTVLATGDSDITDSAGNFQILTERVSDTIELEIRVKNDSSKVTISTPGESGTIKLTIKFNPLVNDIKADNLSIDAKIVGACDFYFENFNPIRQANKVPGPLNCVSKVIVRSNGNLISFVPIAIQSSPCSDTNSWTTQALGATMTGANLGIAQIEFPFKDDADHCLYRIRLPFDVKGVTPVDIQILTLTYQTRK